MLGGVDDELDEDVIDEGACGWFKNDDCAGVVDDELDEEDCRINSVWLSDVGPDCRSIVDLLQIFWGNPRIKNQKNIS